MERSDDRCYRRQRGAQHERHDPGAELERRHDRRQRCAHVRHRRDRYHARDERRHTQPPASEPGDHQLRRGIELTMSRRTTFNNVLAITFVVCAFLHASLGLAAVLPVVTKISPMFGATAGATVVTITGWDLVLGPTTLAV